LGGNERVYIEPKIPRNPAKYAFSIARWARKEIIKSYIK
jgi:hypothetical protein